MPVILAMTLAGVAVGLGAWALLSAFDPARRQMLANLNRGLHRSDPGGAEEKEDQGPGLIVRLSHRLTPNLIVRVLKRQHMLAGRPAAWPLERLIVLKFLWVPVAVVLSVAMLPSLNSPFLRLLWLVVCVVVYFLPELLLNSTASKRQEEVEHSLADTLDQMTIAVEAGLGFDSAMARAAHSGKGALAEELARTLQDIQIGRSRRQAFEGLAERTTVADLRRFVRSIIQADQYGISIAQVLRTQADEMRLKRRQRAEAKAQQLPVKVLAPVMVCILPVLFIVVMAPAVINMVGAFSGL